MEPSDATLSEAALTGTELEGPISVGGGLIGEKRKTPEAETVDLPQDTQAPAENLLPEQPSLEPPAKKSKKKAGGKGKSGKKGSKKSNGRPPQTGMPGEQVEQRALIPATRDSLEVLTEVLLSKTERAPQIQLSADRLTASSTKGYRMVRATHGPYQGAWYFEIKIVHLGNTGHTRLGWSTAGGDLQAPVGNDIHSYSYRDVDGSKVHSALREEYGEGYKEGDVIGCYINLPGGVKPQKRHLVDYRGAPHHYEDQGEGTPQPLEDSCVAFFKNGESQGPAYWKVYGGQYFPAASLYTSNTQTRACEVRFNFGPTWECPPSGWNSEMLGCSLPPPEPVSKLAAIELEEARLQQAGPGNGVEALGEQADVKPAEKGDAATEEAQPLTVESGGLEAVQRTLLANGNAEGQSLNAGNGAIDGTLVEQSLVAQTQAA